ncbi:MAG: hypothetical protein KA734_09365 [Fluviicola sp.]|nr:hypothetical protein [Fluviicola sp.]MBP6271449.1 hypothetical protein [Fluviicola sp.]
MIKSIENNSKFNYFTINYESKHLGCFLDKNEIIKINDNGFGGSQISITHFSKEQINSFLVVIAQAYIFAHKEMKMMIKQELSPNDLENQKILIFLIRNVIEIFSDYLNKYDSEILDSFRKI